MSHTSNTGPSRPRRAVIVVALDADRGAAAASWAVRRTGNRASGAGEPAVADAPAGPAAAPPTDPSGADTAQLYLTIVLAGGFGEPHRRAAETAVAVATEHGFVDDPLRVAEAVVVFLHPDER